MLISTPRCLKGFPYLCATAAYEQQQRPDHRQFDVTAPRILPPKQCLISRLMSFLLDQEMYVRERYKDPFMLCLQMTIPLLFTLSVKQVVSREWQEQLSYTSTHYSPCVIVSIPLTRYGKKDARGVLADATPVPIMQARCWLCEWSVRPRYLFARYFPTTLAIGIDWQFRMACSPQSFPEKASNLGSTPKLLGRDMHKARAQ
jgi:hypothetical protein